MLIMRERKCRWTEPSPVLHEGGRHRWITKSVADIIRRTDLKNIIFKSDREVLTVELKNNVAAELGDLHDIIIEASPVNEHQPNGVVDRVVHIVGGMLRAHTLSLEQSYKR